MKIPKFKFKKLNINLTEVSRYIFTVLISSVILAVVLISLPLTEKITSSATYDLVNKSTLYWSKEYTLELDTSKSLNVKNDVEKVKSILQRRLNRLGVEESFVNSFEKDDTQYVKITVQTAQDIQTVESVIKSPFIVNIVTRKDGIDFDNQDEPLTSYLLENYDLTEFSRNSFRNIYVTQLKNSANEYSYFSLFKTWPWDSKWNAFLKDNAGQIVGVSIDEFVTPVQIFAGESLFAVPISVTNNEEASIASNMYNSGLMPVGYTVFEERDIPTNIAEVDYIKLTQGILIAVILIYLYLLLIEKTPKKILLISGLSTVLTISLWITYLKISEIPTDIFILALEVITVVALIRTITENIESRMFVTVLLSLISAVSIIFGSGYIKIFAYDLLILIILSNISIYTSDFYITNVKRALKI